MVNRIRHSVRQVLITCRAGNAERIVRNPIREMLGVDKSPKSHDFSYVHFAFFAVTSSLYNCAEVESFCLVGLARWLGTVIGLVPDIATSLFVDRLEGAIVILT